MMKKAFAGIAFFATLSFCLSAAAQSVRPAGPGRLLGRGARPAPARNASPARNDETAKASAAGIDEAAEKDKTSDLDFREAPLPLVLEAYSKLVDRTVLKDPAVQDATITVQSRPGQKLTKEEQIEALEVVLEMNGVHMENYGEKFVRALPRDKVRQEGIPLIVDEDADLPETGRVVSMMIPFRNIPIEEAKTVLEGLKSQKGLLLVYERIGKILVTDTQQNINRMREVAREIDVATPINENVFVRQIKNANAEDIMTAIQKIVEESQKELEKSSAAAKTGQTEGMRPWERRPMATMPNGTLLRRPGQNRDGNNNQQPANTSVASIVASVSDADRGMIRGKVVMVPDERSNKIIFVTSKTNMDFFDKVIESLDVETTPDTVVKVYRLKYAEAEDVSDMINDLIGNTQRSGGSRENQNAASKSGQGGNLTRNSQTPQRNSPQQANRGGASNEAKAGELTKDNTQVLADKRINGLIVMTQKELVPTVESIIESMDIKLSQVLIETAIIEISLGDDLKTGIDWVQRGRQRVSVNNLDAAGNQRYFLRDGDGNLTSTAMSEDELNDAKGTGDTSRWSEYSISAIPSKVTQLVRDGFVNNGSYGLGGGGGGLGGAGTALGNLFNVASNGTELLSFGTMNPIGSGINYLLKSDKLNIAAVIQASKTDSRAKYIASPIVMTVDNKEATVDATENRQFLTGWTATSGSYGNSGMPSPNYSAKDIGITLKMTPKINPNGTVMLTIEEEYNRVVVGGQSMMVPKGDTYDEGRIDIPVTRKMTADVLLEDRQTVVLGGLTETTTSESETGIPLLKDIPWIGKWLFGSVSQSESRKELLIFLTPYVLNDAEAAQAEAIRRKKSLSDARPWDDHGWSDSELADPVAKKELLRRLKDEAKKQDEERQNRLAVEKWKLDRAKALEKMSEAERKFWIEQHKDELEKDAKEKFEAEVKEQADLKAFAEELRRKDMTKAEETIRESAAQEKKAGKEAENGHAAPAPEAPQIPGSAPAEPAAPQPGAADAKTLLDAVDEASGEGRK